MRKRRLNQESDDAQNASQMSSIDRTIASESSYKFVPANTTVVKHETLANRPNVDDPHVLVELTSFTNQGKLQPFLVSVHTSAVVVMDVHCSLTSSEVVGYLGGYWDVNNNGKFDAQHKNEERLAVRCVIMWKLIHSLSTVLTVKQSYPCLSRLGDVKRGQACEIGIAQEMERHGLVLVGWYHSHPLSSPSPTVLDIDAQLEYQLKLKGTGDQGYRPCVAMICCE